MNQQYRLIFTTIIFFLTFANMSALDLTVDTGLTASSEDVPFWLSANNWGDTYQDKSVQGYLGTRISNDFSFFENNLLLSLVGDGSFRINDESDINPREVYGKLSFGDFYFIGGLFRETLGYTPLPELTSGSMAVSANAAPIPKITFASDKYIPVPFTKDNLWVKGGISQGWFIDNRYTDNPYLHEKWAYMKFQNDSLFSFHLGLIHEVLWGGEGTTGEFSLEDYINAFFGLTGGVDSTGTLSQSGNTLGIWDLGAEVDFDSSKLFLYKHHYFEDGSGLTLQNIVDGLWGIGLELKKTELVNGLLYEYLNTIDQSGDFHDVVLGGLDRYYSHDTYKSGWTNYGFSLGTPFFITSGDGDSTRISSNRVQAFIFGIRGLVLENRYLVKAAYAKHFFPYTEPDADKIITVKGDSLSFFHMLLEYSIDDIFGKKGIGTTVQAAFDVDSTGNFYPGASVVVSYEFF